MKYHVYCQGRAGQDMAGQGKSGQGRAVDGKKFLHVKAFLVRHKFMG